jgi:hypothetical protein
MVMAPAAMPGEAVLPAVAPVPALLLVQAARTPAESTATALMAVAFFDNQGRSGLTFGSSFLRGQYSSGSSPPDVRMLAFDGYTGRMRFPPDECAEICAYR